MADAVERAIAALAAVARIPRVRDAMSRQGIDRLELPAAPTSATGSGADLDRPRPYLYLPGLPEEPVFDPSRWPGTARLENACEAVRGELENVLRREAKGFKTYKTEHGSLLPNWNTFNFYFGGERFDANCALCPETARVLESLPRADFDHVMFSALNPRSHIAAHVGPMNGILRAHLALQVPAGCRLRVANEMLTWTAGKVLAFDDSYVHEVWNDSDEVRVVLFTSFWHPDLDDDAVARLRELRAALQALPAYLQMRRYQKEPRPHSLAGRAGQPPGDTAYH